MRTICSKLTYANVISTLCLFLLLGGGAAFAATKLGKNTVGTRQLKNGAVTAAKVKSGSLLASNFAAGQLPAGPQGVKGETGKEGVPGEHGQQGKQGQEGNKGPEGKEGEQGNEGKEGPEGKEGKAGEKGEAAAVTTPLKSGETMTGYIGVEQPAQAGGFVGAYASFPTQPPNPIPSIDIHIVSAPTIECPGRGEAEPGNLCIFQTFALNVTPASEILYNEFGEIQAVQHGFSVQLTAENDSVIAYNAIWAYAAP